MADDNSPLSLMEAAAEFAGQESQLDDRGFRVDQTPAVEPTKVPHKGEHASQVPAREKIQSLVGDDDLDSDENQTIEEDGQDQDQTDDVDENDSDQNQEEDADSTIEPPKSFTSDEQAEFKKLPPEMQQTVVRRESERDRALMQRMNQVAEEKQALQPLAQQLQQEQQKYIQLSQLVFQMGVPEAKEFENVDWLSLSRTDPTAYVEKQARYADLNQRMNMMGNHVQMIQEQQKNQLKEVQQETIRDQYQKLVVEMPEFADQTKAAELMSDINQTMQHYGFSVDELNQVMDHRIVKVMSDLAKLRKAEKTRQSVHAKRTGSPAPTVMKPNGSAARGQNKNVELKNAWDKLSKSGDIRDAVRVMNLK